MFSNGLFDRCIFSRCRYLLLYCMKRIYKRCEGIRNQQHAVRYNAQFTGVCISRALICQLLRCDLLFQVPSCQATPFPSLAAKVG